MKKLFFNFNRLLLLGLAVMTVGNVWGYTGTFSSYTSSTLIDGIYVIAASSSASNKNYCMGTTISSGRVTGQTLATSNPGNALVWYIEETSNGWTFLNYNTNTYLKQTSSTSGKGFSLTTVGYFNYDGYRTSSPIGFMFSSKDQTSNNYVKWNNSSKWFSTYASGYSNSGMTALCLYRLPKFRAKTTQPSSGSFTASADGATWDATNKHLSWMDANTTVTLTANPPSGKEVDTWTVTKAKGGTVTVTNNTFTMPSDQVTITVTWKEATSSTTYYLAGSMNGWSETADKFTGSSFPLSVTKNLTANTAYTFKVATNGTWDVSYGRNYSINRQYCTDIELTGSDNVTITTDKAGDYTFNITEVNGSGQPTISVTYPAEVWTLKGFGNWTGWNFDGSNQCQVSLKAGTTYTGDGSGDSGFKIYSDVSGWYGNNGTMVRGTSGPWTFSSSEGNCSLTTDVEGTYTVTLNKSTKEVTITYPTKYTVTYYGNGNTSGTAPAAADYASGVTVTVAGNTGSLEKTGYDFGGWNTKEDGSGTNYTAGTGSFTISANTPLYAKWTIKSYTVTKGTVTGGTATIPSSVNHGGDVTVTDLTPDGTHKLPATVSVSSGEYGSIDGATIKNVTSAITVNVTFTAKTSYTVTLLNNGTPVNAGGFDAQGKKTYYEGETLGTLPTLTSADACDNVEGGSKTFMGWTTETISTKQSTAPSYKTSSDEVTDSWTLRAVWAREK